MKIEILHINECPNWVDAGKQVQTVLEELGVKDVEVGYRLLSTSAEATEVPFAGSPTVLLDGLDAFPSEGRTADLACRVYYSEAGFAGLPTLDQLRDAISAAIPG